MIRPYRLSEAEAFAWFMPGDPPPAPSPTEGCWDWSGTVNSHGYGRLWFNGSDIGAHVISYRIHNDPIEDDLHVLHSCDRRICVQPAHLDIGTPIDNIRDAMSRNRHAKGCAINTAKLTEADVLEIRRLGRDTGLSQKEIGDLFGVGQVNVGQILRRQTWKHLIPPLPQGPSGHDS